MEAIERFCLSNHLCGGHDSAVRPVRAGGIRCPTRTGTGMRFNDGSPSHDPQWCILHYACAGNVPFFIPTRAHEILLEAQGEPF
jgi:hypothetical protein